MTDSGVREIPKITRVNAYQVDIEKKRILSMGRHVYKVRVIIVTNSSHVCKVRFSKRSVLLAMFSEKAYIYDSNGLLFLLDIYIFEQ